MYRNFVSLLLISTLIFVSCTKRSDETGEDQPIQPGRAVMEDNTGKPQRTLSFGDDDSGADINSSSETSEVKNIPRPVNRTLPFYERAGTEVYIPQDRIIGALMLIPPEDSDPRRIHRLVENWLSFLKDTETKSNLEDIYAGEIRDFASQRKSFYPDLKNPVESIRFGRIRFEDGNARMDIRLFSQKGRTSGELVFTFQQGEWRILAENIDLSELEEEYQFPDYLSDSELYGTFQM